ncbi:MAG: FAD-binding oxidoreductase [Gammaproteobacteria bacterium]|nr:FAD-binding oxidoreductase [Gammaproteobacteria bacterium]
MRFQSPINQSTPIAHQMALPREVDIVVVGGGIAGLSTALPLVEQGLSVLVCEKGRVGGEQSSRNWGWVRQTGRDEDEYPIMVESLRLWNEMAARTGENCLAFQEQGVFYVSENQAAEEKYERAVAVAKANGVHSKVLGSSEIQQRVPAAKKNWVVGLSTPSDGRVEPWYAVPAISRAVVRAGGVVIENCAVRSIESSSGQVSEVVTELGSVLTNRVLLAGGAWSSLLAKTVGLSLPQLSVQATVARFDSAVQLYDGNIKDDGLAVCKRPDGGYNMALTDYQKHYIGPASFQYLRPFAKAIKTSIKDTRFSMASAGFPDAWRFGSNDDQQSPFEQTRILDPMVDKTLIERMKQRLAERFATEDSVTVTHAWSGMIDTMPDFVPVLDECPSVTGLFLATGFSGHGFGIGPGAGQVMSELLQGKAPGHDLNRFRFSRFTDSSPLKLGPL